MADTLTLKDHAYEVRMFTSRVLILWVLLAVAMLVLALRMYQLQVLEYEKHATQSDQNRIQLQPIAPTRGLIYDRNGILLADNVPVFSLTVVRERVEDLGATLDLLDSLLTLTPAERESFERRIDERRRPFESVPLRLRLNEDEIARIAVNRFRLPGVEVEAQLIRHYPYADALAHAIGAVRRITPEDLDVLDPVQYSATRYVGRLGVEKRYETALHGEVGYERVETDARGRITRVIDRVEPSAGSNLTLQLDLNLQLAALQALGDRRGAVVAIEPSSGGILALVSNPGYDPNLFIGGIDSGTYKALREDPDVPLFNRALRGQYAPGSTFKPFVGLAGLEYGETDWERTITDPGFYRLPGQSRQYRDWSWRPGGGGQGVVDMYRAIYRSSNVYFYDLGVRLGVDRVAAFVRQFGFGSDFTVDVADAQKGLLPTPAWKEATRGEPWYPGDNVNLGIGQGDLLVTPLQLATAVSIIASRGKRPRPHMIMTSGADLPELAAAPQAPIELADEANWEHMIDAMAAVVHRGNQGFGQNGTAWAYIGMDVPYRMAGKSGTAQVVGIPQGFVYDELELEERQQKHAWFVAFAPVEAPKIAVAVLVENGGGGSSVAAPVAREVLDAWLLPKTPASTESDEAAAVAAN
ncbi:MAG TPA: penicillin-binding protein 2 [Pseudomonadales bacterium]|nr:penicillin-binding protein 2 [Pseudomonadales bacterium]